jgi:hypothetical protein
MNQAFRMNRFKSIFAAFFLLVFTFNVVIYYTVFEVSDNEAKSEMGAVIAGMHSLEGTQCFRLPLSRSGETLEKEIWINGKLYDIVKAEKKADSIVIYVLNDKKEEGLVNDLKSHTDNQSETAINTGAAHHGAKHHSKAPVVQKYFPAAIISFRFDPRSNSINCRINCFYTSAPSVIVAPPPEPLS